MMHLDVFDLHRYTCERVNCEPSIHGLWNENICP